MDEIRSYEKAQKRKNSFSKAQVCRNMILAGKSIDEIKTFFYSNGDEPIGDLEGLYYRLAGNKK